NLAKGMFSIPNVGSHVYVFYINGDYNFPVYFASAYSQSDIKRIYTMSQDVDVNSSLDYPATYENIKNIQVDSDAKTFRSKHVLNSNKHTIEMIDTDLKEILKFTHYSGSFKEFNNYATIELAAKNDQKMVLGDQFLTTQKNKSEYIKNDNETIIGGDKILTIGETKKSIVDEILNSHRRIHEYKRLFDNQRAKYGEAPPNVLSTYQKRSGVFAKCPVCGGNPYMPYNPLNLKPPPPRTDTSLWQIASEYSGSCLKTPQATALSQTSGTPSTAAPLTGFNPPVPCNQYLTPEEEKGKKPKQGCKPKKHPFKGKIGYYQGMKCPCCNGTVPSLGGLGFSPSTQEGQWLAEPTKIPNVGLMNFVIMDETKIITDLEKQLGTGGDEIINISMSKIETIGLSLNDLVSYRIDPIGKLKIDGCHVSPQGTFSNFKPSPHVEYVDVADIPGGDYNLTVMNKYKLLVGSRGINIQTTGPIDIYGTIVNFTGEQIVIASQNEIVIDGGERLSLRARKITFLPVEHNAVVVEGQLHVTRNTILEGGVMIEGELAVLHITAPLEWQETQIGMYDITQTCAPEILDVIINGSSAKLIIPPHTHYFANIPLTLNNMAEETRNSMISKGINSRTRIAASTRRTMQLSCPQSMIDAVSTLFLPIAFNKAKADSGDPDNFLPSAFNQFVTNPWVCNASETQTRITGYYAWDWKGKVGTVSVSANLDSENKIISVPE
ncbi:MAG: hypothetical protein WCG06_01180, partial [Candidatus Omnitrophota bacterium]